MNAMINFNTLAVTTALGIWSAVALGADNAKEVDSTRSFVRGDANDDGLVDVSDAVRTLGYLFSSDDEPACLAAADANDDEAVDLSDAVATLDALFRGGPALPKPGPETGRDPTPGIACGDAADQPAPEILSPIFLFIPELLVSSIEFKFIYNQYLKGEFMVFTVKNSGTWAAGAFQITVRDGTTNFLLQTFSTSGLGVGATKTFYHAMPPQGCGDVHKRKITVDSANAVIESNETNNVKYGTRVDGPC